ncbi:MAG: YebC/PmpR family DNA-binding transcriptional regulator [Deltaproteobacteria bacterium]|nr:YebC/PmpR family DNA-binding transcriptional regulator [Deltaproteobacteria bacterium]
MSGHSKWSTIKHKKGLADAKRSKIFTKLIREITVAARLGGGDLDGNPRLRAAVLTARGSNMSSDTIQRAIKKGSGAQEGEDYTEMTYEGYGPGNVAIVVETLTDNKNRTAGNVRAIFTKNGGSLGTTNSVLFMFDRLGLMEVEKKDLSEDQLMEYVIEGGGQDLDTQGPCYLVSSQLETFHGLKDYLDKHQVQVKSSTLAWVPKAKTEISDKETAEKVLHFIDLLEDDDDVQKVFTNFEITDEVVKQLS